MLSKGSDLKGKAELEWRQQISSANLSLISDDITNLVLRSQALHCYQMRSIVEMIIDLIVFRVLFFGQIKNKSIVKQDLLNIHLLSNLPGATYDGILSLAQYVIRMFRLFIMEDNVISELVRTIVKGISNAGVQYSNKAAEFHSNITNHVRIYQRDNAILLNDMNKKDRHIKVFACVEQYCRELQMNIIQALTTTGPSISMTSRSTAYMTTADTSSPNRFHLRPGSLNNNYSDFYGFNFRLLQAHMLQYWYHHSESKSQKSLWFL